MQAETAQRPTSQTLFSISWPIFIDLLLHLSTLFINMFMVNSVSKAYVASMGVGNQFFNLSVTVLSFISVGSSVVIAQYLGAGKRDTARHVIHVAIAFNFLLAFFAASFVASFSENILKVLNTPEHLIYNGKLYLFVLGLCLLPEALSLIFAACLRVYGYSQAAMYVTLIANIVTVLGNIVALYGLWGLEPLGLYGVGWSTLIGRIVAAILLFYLVQHRLKIKFEFQLFLHWNEGILKKILQIGLPAAGENLLWTGQYMMIFAFIGLLGEDALAAQTIYFQMITFIMSLGIAISLGNEILVGYYVGARQFDLAYKKTFQSLRIGLAFTLCMVTLFWSFKHTILKYVVKDEAVIQILLPLFTITFFMEIGRTLNIVMVNALRASGDARFPMYMGIIFMWGVSVPLAYLLGIYFHIGLVGIWIGFFCDEWFRGCANLWRWRSRKWESKRLDIY